MNTNTALVMIIARSDSLDHLAAAVGRGARAKLAWIRGNLLNWLKRVANTLRCRIMPPQA
jgi:hypothetical protein